MKLIHYGGKAVFLKLLNRMDEVGHIKLRSLGKKITQIYVHHNTKFRDNFKWGCNF